MLHFLFSEMKKAGRGMLWECLTFRGLGNVMDPWPKTFATHNRTADICTRAQVNIVATQGFRGFEKKIQRYWNQVRVVDESSG
jgi:hypothetical protein